MSDIARKREARAKLEEQLWLQKCAVIRLRDSELDADADAMVRACEELVRREAPNIMHVRHERGTVLATCNHESPRKVPVTAIRLFVVLTHTVEIEWRWNMLRKFPHICLVTRYAFLRKDGKLGRAGVQPRRYAIMRSCGKLHAFEDGDALGETTAEEVYRMKRTAAEKFTTAWFAP